MEIFSSGNQQLMSNYGTKRRYNETYSGPSTAYGQKLLKGGWVPSLMMRRRAKSFRRGARLGFGKTIGYSKYKKSEKRFVDSFGTLAVSTVPTLSVLNACFVGNLWFEREGKSTKNLGLDLKIDIFNAGTNLASLPESTCRIMIVWDKMVQGTAPNLTDILLDQEKGGTTQTSILSNVNMNKRDRYEILAQEFIILPAIGIAGVVSNLQQTNTSIGRTVAKYIKVNRQTEFNVGNAGNISDINSGALYLIVWCDAGVQATPAFNAEYNTRLNFYE